VIEDVHWADEGTLDVLRLLGRRLSTTPAVVVASYRDDALDRAHPLRVVLGELATRSCCAAEAAALSPEAVARLAEPHEVDADELYRNTAGNPFFVSEVLAAGPGAVPQTVRDAVLARASRCIRPAGLERSSTLRRSFRSTRICGCWTHSPSRRITRRSIRA
jgi:hypothetical protein